MSGRPPLMCSVCGTEEHVIRSQVLMRDICWNCREKILSENDPVYAKNVKKSSKWSLKRLLRM